MSNSNIEITLRDYFLFRLAQKGDRAVGVKLRVENLIGRLNNYYNSLDRIAKKNVESKFKTNIKNTDLREAILGDNLPGKQEFLDESTIHRFITGETKNPRGLTKDLYAIYCGFAGSEGFKKKISLYHCFDIEFNSNLIADHTFAEELKPSTEEEVTQRFKRKNVKRFKTLLYVIPILTLIVSIIGVIQDKVSNSQLSKPEQPQLLPHSELNSLFESQDSSTFRLLILPFFPDKNCRPEESAYEEQFLHRFEEISAKDNLNIEVRFANNTSCLTNPQEANRLVDSNKIDLVIWGRYEEECDSESKVCVNYSISSSLQRRTQSLNSSPSGSSGLQSISSISSFRHGFLQESIDDLVFWSLSKYYISVKEYSKALKAVDNVIQRGGCPSKFYATAADINLYEQDYNAMTNNLKNTVLCEFNSSNLQSFDNINWDYSTPPRDTAIAHFACTNLSIWLLEKGDINNALFFATRATQLIPDEVNNWHTLAQVYSKMGDKSLAIENYKKAIKVDSNSYASWTNLSS